MKTFAAIDVGSYELAMKIFEISAKSGIREIDHIIVSTWGRIRMPTARSATRELTSSAVCCGITGRS